MDERARHNVLLTKCLILMTGSKGLSENICHLESPGKRRRTISSQALDKSLPADVRYACCYWVHHLEQSTRRIRDQDAVHLFLQKHFLHWLEALSLLGKISESIAMIGTLQLLVAVSYF